MDHLSSSSGSPQILTTPSPGTSADQDAIYTLQNVENTYWDSRSFSIDGIGIDPKQLDGGMIKREEMEDEKMHIDEKMINFADIIAEDECALTSGERPLDPSFQGVDSPTTFSSVFKHLNAFIPPQFTSSTSLAIQSTLSIPPPSNVQTFSLPSEPPSANRKTVPLFSNIQTLSTPARASLPHPSVRLFVLGLPEDGAQNRVETQMKITLILAQDKGSGPALATNQVKNFDGWLTEAATESLMRVGSYSHLKLPSFASLKRRNPKHIKHGIPEEETLFLEVEVVACTTGDTVLCCPSCIERERKRFQRKIENRVRPTQEIPPDSEEQEEDYESKKIIVFNCGQMISFEHGEATLPMRITCYCRHHSKEKRGFAIHFTVKNHLGHIIARTLSPPIMITDNHKAKSNPTLEIIPTAASSTSNVDSTLPKPAKRSRKTLTKETSLRSIRSKRRVDEDDSEEDGLTRREHERKPYERPAITKGTSRRTSKNLAMTPLNLSKPPSPQIYPTSSVTPPPDIFNIQSCEIGSSVGFLPFSSQPSSSAPSPTALRNTYSLPTNTSIAAESPEASVDSAFSSLFSTGIQGSNATSNMSEDAHVREKPILSRVIPSSGPTYGGIEVTILGENFGDRVSGQSLQVMFGDTPATTAWYSSTTLVCTLPPCSTAGPVLVSLKDLPITVQGGGVLPLFTYTDTTDKQLLELALSVVGLQLMGRVEPPANIARRLLQSGQNSFSQSSFVPGSGRDFESMILRFMILLDVQSDLGENDSISHKTHQGHTLLHLACCAGFSRLVQSLITRDIDIDARDVNGYTALHFASLTGRVKITRLLLRAGAARFMRNNEGLTALRLAQLNGEEDTVDVFSKYRGGAITPPYLRKSGSAASLVSIKPEDVTETDIVSEELNIYSDSSDLERRISRPATRPASPQTSRNPLKAIDTEDIPSSRESSSWVKGNGQPDLASLAATFSYWLPSFNHPQVIEQKEKAVSEKQPWSGWGVLQQSYMAMPAFTPTIEFGKLPWFIPKTPVVKNSRSPSPTPEVDSPSEEHRLRIKLAKRLGFFPAHLSETTVESYNRHSTKYVSLKKDRMLFLFWLPIQTLALSYVFAKIFSNLIILHFVLSVYLLVLLYGVFTALYRAKS